MIDTTTGGPVEGQAPAPGTETKEPASTVPTQTAEKKATASGRGGGRKTVKMQES